MSQLIIVQNGYELFENSGAQMLCVRWVMRLHTPEQEMPPREETRTDLASFAPSQCLAEVMAVVMIFVVLVSE